MIVDEPEGRAMTTYVRCRHTKDNRMQECVLVLVADRMACVPIAPSENVVGTIAAGLAMTAVGMIVVRDTAIDVSRLETLADLDAALAGSGGFIVGADWTYRTRVPIIGTMLMRGNENITTRNHVPDEMLARLVLNRAPPSSKVVMVVCGIGTAVLAAAGIVYLATGSLALLIGIGFYGVLIVAIALYTWLRLRKT
jgi:hypothetical protein